MGDLTNSKTEIKYTRSWKYYYTDGTRKENVNDRTIKIHEKVRPLRIGSKDSLQEREKNKPIKERETKKRKRLRVIGLRVGGFNWEMLYKKWKDEIKDKKQINFSFETH